MITCSVYRRKRWINYVQLKPFFGITNREHIWPLTNILSSLCLTSLNPKFYFRLTKLEAVCFICDCAGEEQIILFRLTQHLSFISTSCFFVSSMLYLFCVVRKLMLVKFSIAYTLVTAFLSVSRQFFCVISYSGSRSCTLQDYFFIKLLLIFIRLCNFLSKAFRS